MQNLTNRPSFKTDSHGPYKLNLYYPLPRKSVSVNLSFPAQMCNLSNSDQNECMGIALLHAENKDTLTCQNVTFLLRKKSIQKFTSQNWKQNMLPQNLDAKYAPKISRHWNWMKNMLHNFMSLKLDAKISCKICRQWTKCQNHPTSDTIATMKIRWPLLSCVVKTVEGDFLFTGLPLQIWAILQRKKKIWMIHMYEY